MTKMDIKRIAAKHGGVVAFSKALGLSRSAVSQWTRVPLERVAQVEQLTGVPRADLRPDIFGIETVPPVDKEERAA